MKDIETDIFDKVRTAVISQFPGCYCINEYQRTPREFPCMMLYEADNTTGGYTGSNEEISSDVMYEVQVFSNSQNDRKGEAKAIIKAADAVMVVTGFRRVGLTPAPNLEDTTIYRYVARYEASIDGNNEVARR